jgi:hypothetical protein
MSGVGRDDLPAMAATLYSYECLLGPYHPQTLHLMAEVALALWRHGEAAEARRLLERTTADIGRYLGRDHDLRLRTIAALRDLLINQRDYENAATFQKELLECQMARLGPDHPETLTARATLSGILLAAPIAAAQGMDA